MASEHLVASSSSSAAVAAPALAAGPAEGPKPPASKGRGKRLTDSQRMEIIARLEDKAAPLSRAKVARMYGVTPAAISKLMKVSQHVKKRYTDAGADAGNARDKRQRGGFVKNVCFEDELYQWICSVRARNIPLLVAHVQQKAKLLAHRHKMGDGFKASNGWYYRFCSRYGLTPASLHAGSGRASHSDVATAASASPSATRARPTAVEPANADVKLFPKASDTEFADSVAALQAQVASYGPEFVYNLSEARLFYQLLPSYVRPPPTPAELSSSATAGASAGTANSSSSGPSRSGSASASPSSGQSTESVGKMERVLLLVCTNGTGTHKIPLLVVGKDPAPPSLQALKLLHLTNGSSSNGGSSRSAKALDLSTQYYSQREVWCDRHTFSYWCEHIFLPAIRQRTARPVLLLVENPGGHLDKFQQENVVTAFVPTRSQAGGAVNSGGDHSSSHAASALSNHPVVRMQPMQCGIIRDLKRRYKIALFHAMLTFLERPDDERFRLHQRAAKKLPGCAGISFGRPPHLHDAIRVLDGAWKAIPSDMMRECWVKSELTPPPEVSKLPAPSFKLEVSDELVVLELCSMLRNVTVVDDMNALAKELRQWLNSDDDNSERMQQELLHDIQQLLQEEEHIQGKLAYTSAQQQQQHEQSRHVEPHHQQQSVAQDMMSLNMSAAQRLVAAGIDPAAAAAAMGFDPQFLYRTDMAGQSRQAQHANPAVPPGMDVGMLIREKQKAVAYALRSLAAAEEALDSAFVTEFFGEPTAAAAMETVSHVLRELRRVQRGRQSTLVAAPGASGGPTLDEDAAATTSAHEYFYGPGP